LKRRKKQFLWTLVLVCPTRVVRESYGCRNRSKECRRKKKYFRTLVWDFQHVSYERRTLQHTLC